MKTFHHSQQLIQLQKHRPSVATKARRLLNDGFAYTAAQIIKAAMVELLEEINEPKNEPVFTSGPEWFEECPGCGEAIEEDAPCPRCKPVAIYDLVVATRKYNGTPENPTNPILWWKEAGQLQQKPHGRISLLDWVNQGRLDGYMLVGTEPQGTQLIRRYRRINGGSNGKS